MGISAFFACFDSQTKIYFEVIKPTSNFIKNKYSASMCLIFKQIQSRLTRQCGNILCENVIDIFLAQLCVTRSRERLLLKKRQNEVFSLRLLWSLMVFERKKLTDYQTAPCKLWIIHCLLTPSQGLLQIRTNTSPNLILWISYLGGTTRNLNYTPGVGFFEPWLFISLCDIIRVES